MFGIISIMGWMVLERVTASRTQKLLDIISREGIASNIESRTGTSRPGLSSQELLKDSDFLLTNETSPLPQPVMPTMKGMTTAIESHQSPRFLQPSENIEMESQQSHPGEALLRRFRKVVRARLPAFLFSAGGPAFDRLDDTRKPMTLYYLSQRIRGKPQLSKTSARPQHIELRNVFEKYGTIQNFRFSVYGQHLVISCAPNKDHPGNYLTTLLFKVTFETIGAVVLMGMKWFFHGYSNDTEVHWSPNSKTALLRQPLRIVVLQVGEQDTILTHLEVKTCSIVWYSRGSEFLAVNEDKLFKCTIQGEITWEYHFPGLHLRDLSLVPDQFLVILAHVMAAGSQENRPSSWETMEKQIMISKVMDTGIYSSKQPMLAKSTRPRSIKALHPLCSIPTLYKASHVRYCAPEGLCVSYEGKLAPQMFALEVKRPEKLLNKLIHQYTLNLGGSFEAEANDTFQGPCHTTRDGLMAFCIRTTAHVHLWDTKTGKELDRFRAIDSKQSVSGLTLVDITSDGNGANYLALAYGSKFHLWCLNYPQQNL
ncbi:hypothetical protein M422DRAFT_773971 [Sphaerobolus stellatus SS14]|nr:hypothetical protein M422DRAFT_773971 [Sphaerobolus stellatus SS14]